MQAMLSGYGAQEGGRGCGFGRVSRVHFPSPSLDLVPSHILHESNNERKNYRQQSTVQFMGQGRTNGRTYNYNTVCTKLVTGNMQTGNDCKLCMYMYVNINYIYALHCTSIVARKCVTAGHYESLCFSYCDS